MKGWGADASWKIYFIMENRELCWTGVEIFFLDFVVEYNGPFKEF